MEPAAASKLHLNRVELVNNNIGLSVKATGATQLRALVDSSQFLLNATNSIKVDGSGARVVLSDSYLAGPSADLAVANGGVIESYGDNVIRFGTPDATSAYK